MIALFLQTELASIRHGPRLRELLEAHALPERVVVSPDLADRTESAQRRQLLDMHRGYESRVGLFAGFPRDLRWEWVALTPGELLHTKYIDYDYWREEVKHGLSIADLCSREVLPSYNSVVLFAGRAEDERMYAPRVARIVARDDICQHSRCVFSIQRKPESTSGARIS